jgi:hypothetical protein
MNKRTLIVVLLAAVPLTTACSKDKGGGGGGGGGSSGGQWGAWDMGARTKAWQGAHVMPGNMLGQWDAVSVAGTKVTRWDGEKEIVAELQILSPCEASIMEKSADGSSSGWTAHYTIENGKLVTGLGDTGSRKGATAVACISNKVVTLDEKGTCLEWENDLFDKTKYKSAPGKCGFAKDGDKEVFRATVQDYEKTLEIHGDAMYDEQIAEDHSEQVADYAAAKAARDAKK